MKKFFLLQLLVIIGFFGIGIFHTTPAHAAFNANNLIDDGVFNNVNTMDASTIDNWLNNNFGSTSCISTSHGFAAPDITGYSPSTGFTYGADVSAGTVIYHAARVYGLNPQAILTTLQKEQGLWNGTAYDGCSTRAYTGAMGMGCPDGGSGYSYSGFELYSINGTAVTSSGSTCVNSSILAGFSRQVIQATWAFKFWQQRSEGNVGWDIQLTNYPYAGDVWDNSDDPQSCYSHKMTQGYYQVCPNGPFATFDGLYTIDNTTVHMDNGATAALYTYTPHFPGNQNFDSIFQTWFGSIYDIYTWSLVSQYAYTDNTKTTSVDTANLTVGQKVYVGFVAKNTGTATWYNSGSNPVDAGTGQPKDRMSVFCDTADSPAWMGCNRPANMIEASVAPGQTGTFEFWYKAPAQAGTYNEYFNLVVENLKWMNDIGLYFHTIAKTPTWSIVSQYAFTDNTKTAAADLTNLLPGQKVYIGFQAKNTSGLTWSNSGSNPVHAGTSNPLDRSSPFCDTADSPAWLGCNRPANMTEASVPPGGTATFEFWYKAPSTTGTFKEYFKPVIEGLSWTTDTGMNFYTAIHFDTSGTSTTLGSNQSLATGQSITSSNGNYRLVMQGDGNLVLYSINRALWSSRTDGKPVVEAIMQGDGNLVLYDAQNKSYWSSGTASKGTSTLVMQSDGNLVIYNAANQPTWATYTNGQL